MESVNFVLISQSVLLIACAIMFIKHKCHEEPEGWTVVTVCNYCEWNAISYEESQSKATLVADTAAEKHLLESHPEKVGSES